MLSENEYDYLLGLINVYKNKVIIIICVVLFLIVILIMILLYIFSKNEIKDLDSLNFY